ncbi:MAG: hypothetical protein AB7D37_06185 [Desulfovibrio sp.]
MVTMREQFEASILNALPHIPGFQPAEYRPKEGDPVATFAMIETQQRETERLVRGMYAEIRIPVRDVPSPDIDESIVIDGECWTIRPSTDQSIQMRKVWPFWVVRCRRDIRPVPGGGR